MRFGAAIFLICSLAFAQRAGDLAMLADGKMHVILCGTGSPLADPERAGSCVAVVAASRVILIDVGPGSWRKAIVANVPGQALSAVLLTHFHSDHIGDLGEAMTMSWTSGRTAPLDVYGPDGVEQVVRGFNTSYKLDGGYRVTHHSDTILPARAHEMVAHTIEISKADELKKVFDKNGLAVFAFRVDHRPIEPAFGYRIEYAGRSVVVSGDTSYSENLVRHAAGADLLLHDSMLKNFITMAAASMDTQGQARTAKMLRDIVNYHASVGDAAKSATAAKVQTLVLTHLVPVPGAIGGEKPFAQAAAGFYGKVEVGRDGMRFDLEAKAP